VQFWCSETRFDPYRTRIETAPKLHHRPFVTLTTYLEMLKNA
jgi:hypothetical protein